MNYMLLLIIIFIFSCNSQDANKEINNINLINEEVNKDKIFINSKLVIDNTEGYPILIDIERQYSILNITPTSGTVLYKNTNDSTYNFLLETFLPDSTGKFIKSVPIDITVVFNKDNYKCYRNLSKEQIPKYSTYFIKQLKAKYNLYPKKDKNINTIVSKDVDSEKFIEYLGQLIVASLNGDKECYDIFKKLYTELPNEYFLGSSDESYDQFKEIYIEHNKVI